ncbi:flagellar assembly protein FliH [Hydrogenimonas sp.]|uniref:flagellar assembly protein FliH n=1 Tax=Hydrogenimonas sp. TaxID=2231112 RepID=UPI002610B676|nr:flagellar assembly protein FliH [Hydrogenimonas sp.]
METVIPPDKISGHVIQKYHFKVLSQNVDEMERAPEKPVAQAVEPHTFRELESEAEEYPDMTAETNLPDETDRDEVVEQMLKKADELSTNLVKMQMQLEKQQEEFEKRLETEKERAFEEGTENGRKQCTEEINREIETLRMRLASSIQMLEDSQKQFLEKVGTIEEELIETALDLARQVVAKEIQNDSKEVALRLARLLLTEVKDAATITLKVNPEDFEYIKTKLEKSKNLDIVPDPAVSAGGVIIVSDIGSIDGEIMHRFERIKEAVFGTVK